MKKRMLDSKEFIEKYPAFVEKMSPKTSIIKSLSLAFVFGGLVCCLGQLITDLFMLIKGMQADTAKQYSLVIVIGLTVLLTGIGVFDDISRYSGAGTFLPISGFANAVSSAAIEFKSEGIIFGLCTKIFSVAGPVIVNGIVWSTVAGLLHLIIFGMK